MSTYSNLQKGSHDYKNLGYLYRTVDLSQQLFEIVSQNMSEFPDLDYNDLYIFCETLTKLKWSAVELIGRETK